MANPTHIKDLVPDPANARKHNEHNIGMIVDSLQENGAGRSIFIDEQNVIIAGNGTVEAAAEAGITKVRVVDTDGDEIIAVRRRNLSPEAKRRMALFDNRASELASWDADILKQLKESDADLSGIFTPDALDAIIGGEEATAVEKVTVERPKEVAWVLLAIPVEDWPTHQATIEQLQIAAKFSSMVLRPRAAEPEVGPDGGQENR